MELTSQASTELNPVLVRLFKKRGFSPLAVQDMLSWNLKDLPELTKMKDLELASERLIRAMSENETIAVYGDYDVDGTTSCALLWHFFRMMGVTIEVFQPSRFVEGYGIHPSSIDVAVEKGVKVLMTVDCGISNVATAEYAKGKLDLIITDHHRDAAEKIPEAYGGHKITSIKAIEGISNARILTIEGLTREVLENLDNLNKQISK